MTKWYEVGVFLILVTEINTFGGDHAAMNFDFLQKMNQAHAKGWKLFPGTFHHTVSSITVMFVNWSLAADD